MDATTFTGLEVARRILQCCPSTLLAAHVSYPAQAQALLDAGAATWPSHIPPADLVQALCALLQQPASTG